jgi:hypothetical protein
MGTRQWFSPSRTVMFCFKRVILLHQCTRSHSPRLPPSLGLSMPQCLSIVHRCACVHISCYTVSITNSHALVQPRLRLNAYTLPLAHSHTSFPLNRGSGIHTRSHSRSHSHIHTLHCFTPPRQWDPAWPGCFPSPPTHPGQNCRTGFRRRSRAPA